MKMPPAKWPTLKPPLPLDLMREAVNRQILAQNLKREILVRKMLEQWISECDPYLVYQSDDLIGLGLDGDETGLIVIPTPKDTPQC
jgi:hypothetical protein